MLKSIIVKFGLLAAGLMLLIQVMKYSLFTRDHVNELLLVVASVSLIGLGVFIARLLNRQNEDEKQYLDKDRIKQLSLSKREAEVLTEMAKGKSNREIADSLFITESTIKTHVSSLLVKLDARRRTEALQKARNIGLLKSD